MLFDFFLFQSIHVQIDIKNKKIQINDFARKKIITNINSKFKIFDLIEMKHVKKFNTFSKSKHVDVQFILERIIEKKAIFNISEFEKNIDDSNEKFIEFSISDSDSIDENFQ